MTRQSKLICRISIYITYHTAKQHATPANISITEICLNGVVIQIDSHIRHSVSPAIHLAQITLLLQTTYA